MAQPLAEIAAIIRTVLSDPALEVSLPNRFEALAGWEPMDLIAVVVEVECYFDLQFEVYEIDRLITVGDLVDMVVIKQALTAA